jgi:hypothetical protein
MFHFMFKHRGQSTTPSRVEHMAQWVTAWAQAEKTVFEPIGPHTKEFYIAYWRWSQPHTRIKVTFTVMDLNLRHGTTQGTFAHHCMEGIAGLVSYCGIHFQVFLH